MNVIPMFVLNPINAIFHGISFISLPSFINVCSKLESKNLLGLNQHLELGSGTMKRRFPLDGKLLRYYGMV